MCNCKNISIGSYKRQTSMRTPKGKWVCIDTCLVQEIAELWYLGIETIECCCGHNQKDGYIIVKKEYYNKMIQLGYKPDEYWNAQNQDAIGICFKI